MNTIVTIPIKYMRGFSDLFPSVQAQMVLESIVDGNTESHFWAVADTGDDDAVLLWDKGNIIFYLAGNPATNDVTNSLASLFARTIRPLAHKEGLRYFSAVAMSPQMERVLPNVLRDVTLHHVNKRFYSYAQATPNPLPQPALDGVEFLPIDAELLNDSHLEHVDQVAGEVRWMWPDMERFDRHGFGVAAKWQNQLICWCTAEYVSNSQCGIGIETVPEFQGRNVATATAARFVAESLVRGLRPHWECNAENLASARVAEKVGFALTEESEFWAGQFPLL
jgi:RimJ/RimL family protein N-acetyltransferase